MQSTDRSWKVFATEFDREVDFVLHALQSFARRSKYDLTRTDLQVFKRHNRSEKLAGLFTTIWVDLAIPGLKIVTRMIC